jgi:hypothetical protein
MNTFRDGYTTGYNAGFRAGVAEVKEDLDRLVQRPRGVNHRGLELALAAEFERRENQRQSTPHFVHVGQFTSGYNSTPSTRRGIGWTENL